MKICGKKVKIKGLLKSKPCIRSFHTFGGHRPDLAGLVFGYLTVIAPGGFKYTPAGNKYFTWVVEHKISKERRKVLAHDLIAGRTGKSTACAGGSGIFKHGVPSEYKSIISHLSAICNPKHKQYNSYKGMPFYPKWKDSPLSGYFWIINNLGAKPGKGWSLDIIKHSVGFVPGNLRWVPPGSSIQQNNQIHRTIFDVSDKVFAVEAKRRGYVI